MNKPLTFILSLTFQFLFNLIKIIFLLGVAGTLLIFVGNFIFEGIISIPYVLPYFLLLCGIGILCSIGEWLLEKLRK
jgi:hypothetical protein